MYWISLLKILSLNELTLANETPIVVVVEGNVAGAIH
jgi:hypothetical protein